MSRIVAPSRSLITEPGGERLLQYAIRLFIIAPLIAVIGVYFPWNGEEIFRAFAVLDRSAGIRFRNSVELGLLTVVFSTFFALPVFGFYLHLPVRWKRILLPLSLLPLSFPVFGNASAWMTLLASGDSQGRFLWSADGWASRLLFTLPGTAWILALSYWPILFLFLSLCSRLRQTEVESAALYLRTGERLRRVFLPAWKEPWLAAAALIFSLGMIQFEVPSLMQIEVYPLEIFIRFSSLLREQEALVLCIPYLPALFGLVWIYQRFTRSLHFEGMEEMVLASSRWIVGIFAAGTILVFLLSAGIPLLELLRRSASFARIGNTFLDEAGRIVNAIGFSFIGAFSITLIGLIYTAFQSKDRAVVDSALFLFLYGIPGVLIAAGWTWMRSFWPGSLPDFVSLLTLIFAYVCRFFIFGYLTGLLLWKYYGKSQREQDSLLFVPLSYRCLNLYYPAFRLPMMQATALVALMIWGEIPMNILLHPPGYDTLAVEYFNLLHYGSEARTAAVGMFLLWIPAFIVALIVTSNPILTRNRKQLG